jgi:hypothetical protein
MNDHAERGGLIASRHVAAGRQNITKRAADKFAGISRELTALIHPAAPLRDPLSSRTGRRDRGHIV